MDCMSLKNGENFREAFQVTKKYACPIQHFYINILFFVE